MDLKVNFNIDKCSIMLYGKWNNRRPPQISFGDEILKYVDKEKYHWLKNEGDMIDPSMIVDDIFPFVQMSSI